MVGSAAGMLAMLQVEAAIAESLSRIAVAQIVIASAIAIVFLGTIIGGFLAFRSLRANVRRLERVLEQLVPRVEPLLEKASRIADDANDVSDSLRRKAHELTGTVEELNLALRRASRETQQRVRDFAAVVDVVQQEAESLLLDAAATARGVHTTAESLRGAPATPPRHRRAPASVPLDEDKEVP
jgi:uncharacterized protein YoxC